MANEQGVGAVGAVSRKQIFKVDPVGYEQTVKASHVTMAENDQKFAATGFGLTWGNTVGYGLFGEQATGMITGNYDSEGNQVLRGQNLFLSA